MEPDNCKLCATSSKSPFRIELGAADELVLTCDICGHARISEEALEDLSRRRIKKAHLRGYVRAHGSAKHPAQIVTTTVDGIVREAESVLSVPEKLSRLLLHIGQRTEYPGVPAKYSPKRDFPFFYAENDRELLYLFKELHDQGLIEFSTGLVAQATLRTKGWERIEMLSRAGGTGRQCFVAMSFDEAHRPVWEVIKRAVTAAEFDPYRIDEVHHSDLIPMRILSDIRASRFVVADLTAHKRGVYFEAGFGLGLGRPVIWVCRKDDLDDTHFDVKQYNTILYPDLPYLERHLEARIRALIV